MATYLFYVGTPVDISSKVNDLDAKINMDLELGSLGTYTGTAYNGTTDNVEVTFSSTLSNDNIDILNNLTRIILYDGVVNIDVYSETRNTCRKSFNVTSTPTANHDNLSGYNVGSLVTTSTSVYICTDNTTNTAKWLKIYSNDDPTSTIDKTLMCSLDKEHSKTSSYYRMGVFNMPAMTTAMATCISWMDSDSTSYDILLHDATNNVTILSKNLTNTNESFIDLGPVSNLPGTEFTMEVLLKRTGENKSKVYLKNVTITYN